MTEQLTVHPELATDVDSEVERRQLEAGVNGQYQVVRELGRGGMGVVFLARDIALHRTVAIKVLRHEFVDSEDHRERFRREARLTARLNHPGIVPVYTLGEHHELVYIVMQYVQGCSLAELLRKQSRLSPDQAAQVLYDLAETLDYAHREGMLHRDLKAENVLIERSTGARGSPISGSRSCATRAPTNGSARMRSGRRTTCRRSRRPGRRISTGAATSTPWAFWAT